MNYNSCNTRPNCGQPCGNGNYPRQRTFYSGGRTNANPSNSCTGLYPRGTQHGFDPYTSLPNMMSTVKPQQPYGYIQQRDCTPTTQTSRYAPQQVGRGGMAATPSAQLQMQMQQRMGGPSTCGGSAQPTGAAPNSFSTTNPICPVNVNISAAQLASAACAPIHGDRQECGAAPGTKYISMNWEDILGKTGMNGMKVSMMPASGDSGNGNRQLKVSFGGQGGTMQEGETPLKVVSFQPVSTGRIDRAGISPGYPGSNQAIGTNLNLDNMGQPQTRRRQGNCSCSKCLGK